MLILVWIINPGFDGCLPGSRWCLSMYWLTQSGGWTGSLIAVLMISLAYAFIPLHPRGKIIMFVRTALVLTLVLGGFARINEHYIKSQFAVSRPSHKYIIRESHSKVKLDSVYLLLMPERRTFFKKIVEADTIHFKNIDQRVLAHWVDEVGYSMPSGHTFNAFLLASMLTFSLYELNQRQINFWLYIPMLWAAFVGLSRVVLGVHTPLDVTIGGALGIIVSHGLLCIPLLNRLLVPKRPTPPRLNS